MAIFSSQLKWEQYPIYCCNYDILVLYQYIVSMSFQTARKLELEKPLFEISAKRKKNNKFYPSALHFNNAAPKKMTETAKVTWTEWKLKIVGLFQFTLSSFTRFSLVRLASIQPHPTLREFRANKILAHNHSICSCTQTERVNCLQTNKLHFTLLPRVLFVFLCPLP